MCVCVKNPTTSDHKLRFEVHVTDHFGARLLSGLGVLALESGMNFSGRPITKASCFSEPTADLLFCVDEKRGRVER